MLGTVVIFAFAIVIVWIITWLLEKGKSKAERTPKPTLLITRLFLASPFIFGILYLLASSYFPQFILLFFCLFGAIWIVICLFLFQKASRRSK